MKGKTFNGNSGQSIVGHLKRVKAECVLIVGLPGSGTEVFAKLLDDASVNLNHYAKKPQLSMFRSVIDVDNVPAAKVYYGDVHNLSELLDELYFDLIIILESEYTPFIETWRRFSDLLADRNKLLWSSGKKRVSISTDFRTQMKVYQTMTAREFARCNASYRSKVETEVLSNNLSVPIVVIRRPSGECNLPFNKDECYEIS